MAVDPTVVVAGIGAWASLMSVAIKGALDARQAKHQTNGPLTEIGRRITNIEERTARTEERTARVERYLASEARARRPK